MNALCLSAAHCSYTLPIGDSRAFVVFTCVLMALAATLIIVLNPLCLVVLYHARDIQKTTKIFITLLTVSDLHLCQEIWPCVGINLSI